MYDIPIVFFIFKRPEKSVQILKRIGEVQPKKLYIISDAGRTEEERAEVEKCRAMVEENIDWDCQVIKNYAQENKGCFDRIGLGALWVLEREECAVFLEDDNYPEPSFFQYCKELLEYYKNEDDVLWVCGTNYMETYQPESGADYVFTHHMLPCGWATWSHKFTKYYDAEFSNLNNDSLEDIKKRYTNKRLYKRDLKNWKMELTNKEKDGRYCSWDYQMCFSLRFFDKLGIAPKYNQIRNIGVDDASEHGGNSFDSVMTQRFCGMGSKVLQFPLKHPEKIEIDATFEALTDKIVLPPFDFKAMLRKPFSLLIRAVFQIPEKQTIKDFFAERRENRKNEK